VPPEFLLAGCAEIRPAFSREINSEIGEGRCDDGKLSVMSIGSIREIVFAPICGLSQMSAFLFLWHFRHNAIYIRCLYESAREISSNEMSATKSRKFPKINDLGETGSNPRP